VAQAAVGHGGLFAVFQASSAVLLLAAASSASQAGPACSRPWPSWFWRSAARNRASFLCGMASMTRLFHRSNRPWLAAVSVSGALAVGLTLGADFAHGYPSSLSWLPA
jgi:hypothetical protein